MKRVTTKMQYQDKPEQAGTSAESADVQFLAENKTKAGVKLLHQVCNISLLKKVLVSSQQHSLLLKFIMKVA